MLPTFGHAKAYFKVVTFPSTIFSRKDTWSGFFGKLFLKQLSKFKKSYVCSDFLFLWVSFHAHANHYLSCHLLRNRGSIFCRQTFIADLKSSSTHLMAWQIFACFLLSCQSNGKLLLPASHFSLHPLFSSCLRFLTLCSCFIHHLPSKLYQHVSTTFQIW